MFFVLSRGERINKLELLSSSFLMVSCVCKAAIYVLLPYLLAKGKFFLIIVGCSLLEEGVEA